MVSQIISVLALASSAMALSSYNTTTNGTSSGSGSGSGVATSPYSTGNSTSSSSGTGNASPYSNSTILTDEKLFCNFYSYSATNQRGYKVGGVTYEIECGANFGGVLIEADLTVTLTKRAVAEPGLPNCINNCNAITADSTATCVATSYNRDTDVCKYYSSVTGPIADPGNAIDFAMVIDDGTNASGALAGSAVPLTTSVVPASTHTYTIYSCAATVTDCPYNQVATSVVAAYTTVCPGNAAASAVASPVACSSCAYSAQVVTVYTASTASVGGATAYVAVATSVIAIPTLSGSGSLSTGLTTTIATGTGALAGTATASGVVAYTGAAFHVEAGMGMAALVGAAALLI